MSYYKKVDQFNNVLWVAQLEQCTDVEATKIEEDEYFSLINVDTFD